MGAKPPLKQRLPMAGLTLGFELLAAMLVGIGIGWLLDSWLGTKPWMMIVWFILGVAAGLWKTIQSSMKIGRGPT